MKPVLFVAAGQLCACAWQANAQTTAPSTEAQTSADTSEGPAMSGNSMSGAPAELAGKSRAEVYQDLVRSQHDGETAQLHALFKGN